MAFDFHISIHAPRGGSDADKAGHRPAGRCISIHAPRGGSDLPQHGLIGHGVISIHAPRGGSDDDNNPGRRYLLAFQSTLPVGGATLR